MTAAYVFDNYHRLAVQLQNAAFVNQLSAGRTDPARVVFNTEECVKFVGLASYSKNKRLFDCAFPGELSDASGDPGTVEEWITCLHNRTRESHLVTGSMRLVSPEYEVIELHVLRAEWVARYWLSTLADVEQYPIQVPSWEGLGYLKDNDRTVLIHLCEYPRATLRPGQRVHVISCNCKPGIKINKCRKCKCGKHGVPCSK